MARHRITEDASRAGRELLRDRSVSFHFGVYHELRAIAREEGIAPTLAGIAEQLNRRGLRTNRGKLFDFRKVAAALQRLGVDRLSIARWQQQARDKAVEWDVPRGVLRQQLWHEWMFHVAVVDEPFVPKLVHPDEWVAPWIRHPEHWTSMVTPPQARVVHLFLGPFEDKEDW
jgi:hypothetical protein